MRSKVSKQSFPSLEELGLQPMELKGFRSQKQIDRLKEAAQHLGLVSTLLKASKIEEEKLQDPAYNDYLEKAQDMCLDTMVLVSDALGTLVANDLVDRLYVKDRTNQAKE